MSASFNPEAMSFEPDYDVKHREETVFFTQLPGLGAHIPGLGSLQQPQSSQFPHLPFPNKAQQQSSPSARPSVVPNVFQRPPRLHIFAGHCPPTIKDINATDEDVIYLINELPSPSSHTLRILSTFNVQCDTRPRTPGQADGSRYGLILGGIAAGCNWSPPAPKASSQCRVRPRHHESWGGSGSAMADSWGREDEEHELVADKWSGAHEVMKIGWDSDEE
ncbi:hypothetical protein T440DRAFT_517182 [Plenodomus tracheiphilus IPT5]|uniref:Uncharacterized protein n=1 Tax=Plenodomus tracheiphilus IPT5 TaxID=1408161 RepID=A0A6A7B8L8_9PLEO|nr:hypothetical protein T440DRAFT_517182 [Plenodomus tracheiphilus IPT5]